jgi:hypothetical protein
MTFLKLTYRIINVAKINQIIIHKNNFDIYLNSGNLNGAIIFGSGSVDSKEEKIEVCEKNDPEDFKIVKNWIKNINNCYM